jgi:hypothetical protein
MIGIMKTYFAFKKTSIAILFSLFLISQISAQVGINTSTPAAGSMLDIDSSEKGSLMPRVTLANPKATYSKVSNEASFRSTIWIDKSVDNPEAFLQEASRKKTNDAVHFITHGRSGELFINGKWLQKEEIAAFINSKISNLQSSIFNLYIYGCNFANGEKGLEAVTYIEKATDLKISASTNITGKDGDWVLEVGNANTSLQMNNYWFNLQCVGIEDSDGDLILNADDLDDDNDGISDIDEGCDEVFDLEQEFGSVGSVIVLDGSNSYTITDFSGTGIDIRLTEVEGGRVGWPRVFLNVLPSIQASTDIVISESSQIDLVTTVSRRMIYRMEFFDAGTTNPVSVCNFGFYLGDVDETEMYGNFSEQPVFGPLPLTGNVSLLNNPTTGDYLQANTASVPNNTVGGDLTLSWPNPITSVEFTCEKSAGSNLGLFFKSFEIPGACTGIDTDGDGIPNHLDLDSDGDGCQDAIEGDGNYTLIDLENSSLDGGNTGPGYTGTYMFGIIQNLGNTVDGVGFPNTDNNVVTDDSQGVGTSQDGGDADACKCLSGDSDAPSLNN